MENYTYNFELKDILIAFANAFNSIIIKRYNSSRVAQKDIQVGFVYSPKHRVIHDLVNKEATLKLPIVAYHTTNISYDNERAFNKLDNIYTNKSTTLSGKSCSTDYYEMPSPVKIGISMSIIARYQQDIDQIISNFLPYSRPYIVISWKTPRTQNPYFTEEIRSEVFWDGNISIEHPIELASNDKARTIANTNFTINGWVFKNTPSNDIKNIYTVESNFIAVSGFDYE